MVVSGHSGKIFDSKSGNPGKNNIVHNLRTLH